MYTLTRSLFQGACRVYPLLSGYSRIANSGLLSRATHGHHGLAVTRMRNGTRVFVNPDDADGRIVYYFGDRDPKITWVCRKVLRRGDVMLDVGANYGAVSMMAANLVGPEGAIHAFEPQRNLAELIHVATMLNGCAQIQVHRVALSDQDGSFKLYIRPGSCGEASLEADEAGKGYREETVTVRHAGAYFSELNMPSIRLMKIDVEGHEAAVIRGAVDVFTRTPPTVIVFESKEWKVPFWNRDLIRVLGDLGYTFYAMPKAAWRMRLEPINRREDEPGLAHDYVAVHQSADATVRRALNLD